MAKESKYLHVQNSTIDGRGLYSSKKYSKGQFISYINGPIEVYRSNDTPAYMDNWIGVGKYSWINTDKSLFKLINHSCNPNVAIRGARTVFALTDIPEGVELTMDYSFTEGADEWSMKCECDSNNCRKEVGAVTTIPYKTFKQYYEAIPLKFRKIFLKKL